MLQAGTRRCLVIDRIVSVGAYLREVPDAKTEGEAKRRAAKKGGKPTDVLLPKKEVPEGAVPGMALDVFLYLDSEDRPIATRRTPKIELHGIARLMVKQTGKIGAFMDWGLEKDVLLPYAEQTRRVKTGESVLCALYEDKSGRLAVTMNVYPYLRTDSPYLVNMEVEGTVYETSANFGVFVAVDDRYSGLIPKREVTGEIRIGDCVSARVTQVREDGKLTLALRKKAYLQMDDDAARIMEKLTEAGGVLPYGDKSDAEEIRRVFGLSKAAFKRACGRLYKEGKILVGDTQVRME